MNSLNLPNHQRLLLTALLATLILLLPTGLWAQAEVGEDDFRISHAGPDGDPLFDATHDGSAYNSTDNEFLVVWDADTVIPGPGATFNGKREVFGRVLNGDATFKTAERLLATSGPSTDETWDAQNPEVTYNSTTNEYYLTYVNTIASNGLNASKTEIFGLRIANTGVPIGAPARLSNTGSDTDLSLDSKEPSVTYNSVANEVLVVWQREVSDDGSREENEIFARRIDASGVPRGSEVRVSTMGPNGSTSFDAVDPYVAYGSSRNEYLVVWRGDDDRAPLVNGEFEIFGQRLNASAGAAGADDFRISQMGPNGDASFDAFDPAIAYNPDLDEFLVTWTGVDDLDQGEEVYGQILRSDGTISAAPLRISNMGANGLGADAWVVDESLAIYNPAEGEYFVIWIGEDDRALLAVGEFEVFGQRLDADGSPVGVDDVRISTLGPEGSTRYDPFSIDLTYNSALNEYLVIFSGDDNPGSLTDDEVEIFGQRIAPRLPTCLPDAITLCLSGGRFKVTVDWRTSVENDKGQATPLTQDSGWFWFFADTNAELVVKVLDAQAVNGKFWVFFGALSDVEYVLQIQDTETGEEREYRNAQGTLASVGDINAFPLPPAGTSPPAVEAQSLVTTSPTTELVTANEAGTASCTASPTTLCLNEGRFKVEIDWSTTFGTSGEGQAIELTSDTGWFWFFDSANTEVMIKVLDGRVINGNFWVFFGSLSDVQFDITITDTVIGTSKTFSNPNGSFASVADVGSFPSP